MNSPKSAYARSLPYQWGYIAWGTAVVTVAAIVCAFLMAEAVGTNSINLTDRTRPYIDKVEQLLVEKAVSSDRIVFTDEGIRIEGRDAWRYFSIDVDLPPTLEPAGMAAVLRKHLRNGVVTVSEQAGLEGASRDIRLAYENHEFARVTLKQNNTPELDKAHLSLACERSMNDVVTAIKKVYPALRIEFRSVPDTREDNDSIWSYIEIVGQAGSPVSNDVLEATLGAVGHDVETHTTTDGNETRVSVSFQGLECGVVTLNHSPQSTRPFFMAGVPETASLAMQTAARIPPLFLAPAMIPSPRTLNRGPEPTPEPAIPPSNPRVAIIVDDGGYYEEATNKILSLDNGLTLSILPFAPLSTDIAIRGAELGFEIMLHMPMECFKEIHNAPGYISPSMTALEIETHLDAALAQIPGAVGLNNHTGSKFTSDGPAMTVLLEAVAARSLFFIDSRTTTQSCALETALAMRVPTVPRDLFLDNSPAPAAIIARFRELMDIAKRNGTAVGICHFRPNTASVMGGMIQEIQREGIDIVHVSTLLR